MKKVLLVEDNALLNKTLTYNLTLSFRWHGDRLRGDGISMCPGVSREISL